MKLSIVKLNHDPRGLLRENLTYLATTFAEAKEHRREMERLCREFNGIGLAANQAGLRLNMFLAMRDARILPSACAELVVCPSWQPAEGAEQYLTQEGCLSLEKGKKYPVKRWTVIQAEWIGANELPVKRLLKGAAAQVFQHESDHLRGVLLVDHTAP